MDRIRPMLDCQMFTKGHNKAAKKQLRDAGEL